MSTTHQPEDPHILVVAAHLPELEGLVPLLGKGLLGRVGTRLVEATPVGIGLCAAACGMADRLTAFRRAPEVVVLVGTCGAYRGHGLELGSIAVSRQIRLASVAVVEGQGILPGPMDTALEANGTLAAGMLRAGGAQLADVATTLAITSGDALAQAMAASHGCSVEHLEAYAVAHSCARRSIPMVAVLGVANSVGVTAHAQWLENHVRVGTLAAQHVARWLEQGTARLSSVRT